ncbi:SAM-dependent methyltransferase [Novosphingobium sp. BL-52-GroH]|uniref:SAM-dependent methyltransferase n=1 Tax=Novosphingobium sp. BL-52-GroH TaxID=3349877 RepID=UPI00384B73F4
MTRHETSLGPAYFETMFQGTDDPWNLESSPYEQAKYAHTIEALGGRRYSSAFEIGCAKGVLTHRLAPLCDRLLAIDVSATALRAARARCSMFEKIAFANMIFPSQAPEGAFDLVVLSEVAYYWDDGDIRRAGAWLRTHLAEGGDVILVHWTGDTDYPQSGDGAVETLRAALGDGMEIVSAERHPEYRLDLWRRLL